MIVPSTTECEVVHWREDLYDTNGAATLLMELGIKVRCGEKELIEEELKEGWRSGTKRKRNVVLPTLDLKALLQEGDYTNSKNEGCL